jgi:hypothetical protein
MWQWGAASGWHDNFFTDVAMINNSTQFKTEPLDARQLLSFITVAKTRNFTEAGKELCLSQSAVSHAVKALEDELGHQLLDRDGKKYRSPLRANICCTTPKKF